MISGPAGITTVSGRAARPVLGAACGFSAGVGRSEVLGGLDVGEHVPDAQHLRARSETGRTGCSCGSCRRRSGPSRSRVTVWPNVAAHSSKCSTPAAAQQVRAQVALHHVRLGDAVGDRRRGRERRDALAVPRRGATPASCAGPWRAWSRRSARRGCWTRSRGSCSRAPRPRTRSRSRSPPKLIPTSLIASIFFLSCSSRASTIFSSRLTVRLPPSRPSRAVSAARS